MVCSVEGCCAEAAPESTLCVVHASFTIRGDDSVPIHCYGCGKLIRRGSRWIVRPEGSFHARPLCLIRPADAMAIQVGA